MAFVLLAGRSGAQSGGNWLPLGPTGVISQNYGLVTGRITALALDPSDLTGNTLYVGTTGGGVWKSQNAGTSSTAEIVFTPLTDNLGAMSGALDASISIGALSVQPGGTGVVLAGTGDPNDALDSYYGAGILRSVNGGATWSLIHGTADRLYLFAGESVAGFAWSTVNPQMVVAAVSEARAGTLVGAQGTGGSYEGLYYSSNGGATWSLATIKETSGKVVQGPNDALVYPNGNAATAVVWNPVRKLFMAAVRYHGYYQSWDGITWTRMAVQPGAGLQASANMCPTVTGSIGSIGCPIFRGALAVNPQTGDTFAWTVDAYNRDQGIWQDLCVANAGACTNLTVTFAQQWGTGVLESAPPGDTTIRNGDYNLTLAAVPSGQTTMLLAGANDLWKTTCPYSQGCRWQNTTNSTVGFCAAVGEYQHALEWNTNNPLEIFIGNDSGLWRSEDAIGEVGTACAASDATHFQNLNGSLGSLGEVVSLSQTGETPFTMMASLGTIGTAGVNSSTGTVADWPEFLGGEGGPVAIDPVTSSNWYVNNGAGVSIYKGLPPTDTTPSPFAAVLNATTDPGADVVKDGYTMDAPAPFLVDPADSTQLLIGSCRVWRGPADGTGWSDANAISPILDGNVGNATCSGDAQIRSIAALPLAASASLPSGGEIVYVGMYSAAGGGASLPGHVLSGTVNFASGAMPVWTDLTLNPVTNDTRSMNHYGNDISSIFVDPHDQTGNTVYVTVAGFPSLTAQLQTVYRSTDGGAHWASLMSNLPAAPANGLVVDPLDAHTVYVATDVGVYSTRAIASCANVAASCWSSFGSGLPLSPVVQISAAPATASVHNLVVGTYGRGIWMVPLWTSVTDLTTATALPSSLSFASQAFGVTSSAQTVTVTNTGSHALTIAYVQATGDFSASGNCSGSTLQTGQSCTVQVSFTPSGVGSRTGVLEIYTNVSGGELTVALSGTGTATGAVNLTPSAINFNGSANGVLVGQSSAQYQVTASNSSSSAVAFSSAISGLFSIVSNACGSSIPAQASCKLNLVFSPTQTGAASGTLTFTDASGTQTVALSGTGVSMSVTPATINFNGSTNGVLVGQSSPAFQLTVSNSDSQALPVSTGITGPFSIATNACGSSIPAAGSCNLTLLFTPTQAGAASGTLTFTDTAGTQTVALSGTGLALATEILSTTALTFPGTIIGQLSAAQTITLTNNGGVALSSISVSVSGAKAADFQVTNPCTANLAPISNCVISVQFNPSVVGSETAVLTIASSAADSPKTVALSGTGIQAPALGVSPPSLSFTAQTEGQASAAQTVTVTNTGGASLNNVGFQINTVSGGTFSCSPNSCDAISCPTLASGAHCTVQIIFTPSVAGGSAASLVISSSNSTPNQVTVPLSGGGLSLAGLNVSPTQLSFPITATGQSSAPQTVTITNNSGSVANALTLTATPPFGLVPGTCGTTLAAGANCTAGVNFAPSVSGSYTGTLTITSSSASSAGVALSGTGGAPGSVSFLPSLLSFAQTGVGQVSGASTVTITNLDSVNSLSGLALAVTSGFQLGGTSCTTTLAPGANCTASVAFAPLSAGAQNGSLTVTSNASATGSSMALSGVGFDFTFAISGSASQTISSGQIANFNLVLNPLNGSQGSFSFQCGTLPSSMSCTFNPTTENVSANATGNVTVAIATGLKTSARSVPLSNWPALPLACGLALLPFALRRRHRALAIVIFLAVLVGGVSSCTSSSGGSSSGTGGGGGTGTTSQNYSIVVTASSNGVSHPITLKLTVD